MPRIAFKWHKKLRRAILIIDKKVRKLKKKK